MRKAAAAVLLTLASSASAAAQPTNLAVFQELAVSCLGSIPGSVDSLTLEAPEQMPYVRSALVTHWQNAGRTIFRPDSAAQRPHLTIAIDDARVSYERQRRDLAREVVLALRYTFAEPSGRILADDRCVETHSDLIPRDALALVQDDAYPETRAEIPQGGWFRRYVEPAVITAATAVAVYLFFSLRSTRADDS